MQSWNDLLDAATDSYEPVVTFKANDGWESTYGLKKSIYGTCYVVERPQFDEHYHYVFTVDEVQGDVLKVVYFKFKTRVAFDINIKDITNVNILTKEVA